MESFKAEVVFEFEAESLEKKPHDALPGANDPRRVSRPVRFCA
jgi:hypothetical protein